ncbi:hypothetical protein N0V92_008703 [Colletotrichum tropicale]|nr:hypothetical protein N0V92_008703 [Colletotrichum tropicale]
MNDFQTSEGIFQEPCHIDDNSSEDDAAGVITGITGGDGQGIVTHAPKEGFRLGYLDVCCLVINRMIGGDMVYLQYVFSKPAYRKNTILLSTCIFGITFIVLGNMAGNSLHFAFRVLEAAGHSDPENGPVRGIALAVAVFACFIHATSRRFGIMLNNFLAVIKIMIMLLIIVAAIVVGAGGLPKTQNVIEQNTSPKTSFAGATKDANGYAQAFLAIIFTFSGFEQPNYVLGEISRPRKKFPIGMASGVGLVAVLYLAVNICYMVVVPADVQKNEANVAQEFFRLTFGQLNPDSDIGSRIFNAFLAISSMGNIIVMTYTAARVKQEIAKETPVGALVLHLVSCVILIFATYGRPPVVAYTALTSLSAYVVNAFIGTFLGLGILILRFRGPPTTATDDDATDDDPSKSPTTWAEMTGKKFRPFLSVFCAIVYMCGGLYPVITNWVPPSQYSDLTVTPWWLVPTVGWIIISLGVAWFIGFILVARYIEKKDHRVFVVEKKPEFEAADGSSRSSEAGHPGADLIQVHETVYLSWVGKEALRQRRPVFDDSKEAEGHVNEVPASPYVNTDFAAYMSSQGTETGRTYSRY